MMRKTTFALAATSLLTSITLLCVFILGLSKSPTRIFQQSLSSVVEVRASTGDTEAFGTAVILSDSELVTNFHVISYTSQSVTYIHAVIEFRYPDSNDYSMIQVKKYDTSLDLAILEMDHNEGKKFKVNTSRIQTGQKVYLLGNANNLGISLTTGVISRNEVEIHLNSTMNRYIQIDATSTGGVSGGALLNENGELIGIITLRLLDSNGTPIYGYVFAIPIHDVLVFAASPYD